MLPGYHPHQARHLERAPPCYLVITPTRHGTSSSLHHGSLDLPPTMRTMADYNTSSSLIGGMVSATPNPGPHPISDPSPSPSPDPLPDPNPHPHQVFNAGDHTRARGRLPDDERYGLQDRETAGLPAPRASTPTLRPLPPPTLHHPALPSPSSTLTLHRPPPSSTLTLTHAQAS